MVMGQAQFTPYQNMWGGYQQSRLPVYHAEPIHGEMAAWQFMMGPNSEIWLPDANEDVVWWIRTDANGNRTVMDFDITPRKKAPQIDTQDLAARVSALEEWMNGKQNKSNAKRSATATTTATEPIN